MKKGIRRALCMILTFVLVWTTASAADVSVTREQLNATAKYCYEKIPEPEFGSEWFLYCFTASEYPMPAAYKSAYYSALERYVREHDGVLETRKYTEYSRTILALTALGHDPADVGGYDLLQALSDFEGTMRQGLNGAVFALLALDSGNYRIPKAETGKVQATRGKYVTYLTEHQLPDGGFAYSGTRSDHDMTAMVLQALAKYRGRPDVEKTIEKALAYLSAGQHENGGFDNWGTENSESCSQVILALCELGISPSDPRFVKSGNSPVDVLQSYRQADGSYAHVPGGDTDMLATRQAFMALTALWRTENGKSSFYTQKFSPVFRDTAGTPYRMEIDELARANVVSGRGNGCFDPGATMTRAEFASLIVRAIGGKEKPSAVFRDVPAGAWYAGYVGAAYDSGIVKGVSGTEFAPDNTITVSEAEVMTARTARLLGLEPTTSETWYPTQKKITRGEMAGMLYGLLSEAGLL